LAKFCKEDFTYIKRFLSYYGYYYDFSVHGETANYLINKYKLEYPNIQVHLFAYDSSITVGSKTNDKLKADITEIDDEDFKELFDILLEVADGGKYYE
jgi:hypothetical protein